MSSRHFAFLVWLTGSLLATPAIAQRRDLGSDRITPYRGMDGKRITVVCAAGAPHGTVWGTDVYSDDSSVCNAAVHAGLISAAEGGAVTAVIAGPRPSFAGSERNGVTSRSFGDFPGSFTVEKGDGGEIDWSTTAAGLQATRPLTVVCPAGESSATGTVWGSGTYSDDSPICAAAVHAGVITPEKGGRVVIESAKGRTSYTGTSRNGVRSRNYGSWPRSFRFEGLVAEAEASPDRMTAPPLASPSQPSVARAVGVRSLPSATPTPLTASRPAQAPTRIAASGRGPIAAAAEPSKVFAGVQPTDPPAVHATGFRAYAGYGRIVLDWKPVAGAHGYRLARSSWDAGKLAWIPGSGVEFPKDRPSAEDVVYTQKWEEYVGQDGQNQLLIYWYLASESNRIVPSGTVKPETVETPASVLNGQKVAPATRWITTVTPRGALTDTSFTDAAVTPGTQYVYWLDTWFKSGDGTFYSPTAGPYPTVTANPRNPAGMSWLPPAVERDSAVKLKQVVPSADGILVEWEPKRLVAGYMVMRTIIDTTHPGRYLGKTGKCYPFVRASFSNASSIHRPMTPKQDTAFCLGIFAIYPDELVDGTPVSSARSINMNAWGSHHEALEKSIHSKGLFISAEWDRVAGRWRILPQGSFPVHPCMTGGYSDRTNGCVRGEW